MKYSSDQEKATRILADFLKSDRKLCKLQGVAGSGKSTVISRVLSDVSKVHYAAPTAKAAKVLIDKGTAATTLHSLMLQPVEVEDEVTKKSKLVFKENPTSILWGGGVVCIDESSMVAGWLAERLMQYPVKVIAVGDPFQLPPVRSSGSLLTGRADAELTEVHRQALDSPVLELATYVRERGQLPAVFERGQTRVAPARSVALDLFDQVLVGTHRSRFKANNWIRKRKGRGSFLPEVGESVLAKKNDLENGIVNGGQYLVRRILDSPDDFLYAELVTDEGVSVDTTAWKHGFTGPAGLKKLEDMGFKDRASNLELWHSEAITVHSSQGSEWDDVLVLDESKVFRQNAARWLYTGITRARESVTVIRR